MLGKILLTASVIVLAFFFVRRRDMSSKAKGTAKRGRDGNPALGAASASKTEQVAAKNDENTLSEDMRLGAYMFLVLVIALGAALYYFQWQDDHTVLSVRLHSDGQDEAIEYQVYKFQLGDRSFTTLNGILVTVASSERMEVEGL